MDGVFVVRPGKRGRVQADRQDFNFSEAKSCFLSVPGACLEGAEE